jgi:hypothetical protein
MRLLTWLVLGLLLLAGSPLRAQQPPAAQPAPNTTDDARDHFKRGEAAYEKGNYTLAVSEWQAAYATDQRPRIQYNIYQALERLGQLPEAAEALQRYLSTADPDDPYYSDATARAAALQQRLQATGIRLVGGVEGGSINVSGHDWGRLPRPDRIPVQPGNHRILIALTGYKDFVANVVVPPGQVVDVQVQQEPLAAVAAPAPAAASASTQAATREAHTDATPFFVASAVLGAGAVVSAIWIINRSSELTGCSTQQFYCPHASSVRTERTVAIGLTAALGAGAIGTLIYGLIVNGEGNEHAALCVPGVMGATCRVQF